MGRKRGDALDCGERVFLPLQDGTVLLQRFEVLHGAGAHPGPEDLCRIYFHVRNLCWLRSSDTLVVYGSRDSDDDAELWIASGQQAALAWDLQELALPEGAPALNLSCWTEDYGFVAESDDMRYVLPLKGLPSIGVLYFEKRVSNK